MFKIWIYIHLWRFIFMTNSRNSPLSLPPKWSIIGPHPQPACLYFITFLWDMCGCFDILMLFIKKRWILRFIMFFLLHQTTINTTIPTKKVKRFQFFVLHLQNLLNLRPTLLPLSFPLYQICKSNYPPVACSFLTSGSGPLFWPQHTWYLENVT